MSLTPSATRTGTRPLVVKITCGEEALERLNQGLTVASTALAAGADVSVWLTGDATWMAVPGRAEQLTLPHGAPLHELRDALLEGASVTVIRPLPCLMALVTSSLTMRLRGMPILVGRLSSIASITMT